MITQGALQTFQTEMGKVMKDPYKVIFCKIFFLLTFNWIEDPDAFSYKVLASKLVDVLMLI